MKETRTIVTLTDESGKTIHPKTLTDAVINLETGKSVARDIKDLMSSVAEKGKEVTEKIRKYKEAVNNISEYIDTEVRGVRTELNQAVSQLEGARQESESLISEKIDALENTLTRLSGVSERIDELFSGKISKEAFSPRFDKNTGELAFDLGQGLEKKVKLDQGGGKVESNFGWETSMKIRFSESGSERVGGDAEYEWINRYNYSDIKRYGNGKYVIVPVAKLPLEWGESYNPCEYLGGKFFVSVEKIRGTSVLHPSEYEFHNVTRRYSTSFKIRSTVFEPGAQDEIYEQDTSSQSKLVVEELEQFTETEDGRNSTEIRDHDRVFECVHIRFDDSNTNFYLCVCMDKKSSDLDDSIYKLMVKFEGFGFTEVGDYLTSVSEDGEGVINIWKNNGEANVSLRNIPIGKIVENKRLPYIDLKPLELFGSTRSIQKPETITIIDDFYSKYGISVSDSLHTPYTNLIFLGAIPSEHQYYYNRSKPVARYKFYLEICELFGIDIMIDLKSFNPNTDDRSVRFSMRYQLSKTIENYEGKIGEFGNIKSLYIKTGGRHGDIPWINGDSSRRNDTSILNYLFLELHSGTKIPRNPQVPVVILSATKEWALHDIDLFAKDYLFEPLKLYSRSEIDELTRGSESTVSMEFELVPDNPGDPSTGRLVRKRN